ncbi:MAG: hypothetical protein MHM6MM_003099 [Cercozoa sp. M6MM]
MSADKIRAWAAFNMAGEYKQWEYEARPLGKKEVRIQIAGCGICGSDVHTARCGNDGHSDWGQTTYPVVVGHEIVGRVVAAGSEVTDLAVGDNVGVGAQVSSCQDCPKCEQDRDAYCPSRVFTYNAEYPANHESAGHMAYGGYADQVIVPAAYAFKIPEAIDPLEAAPLFCAGVTVASPLFHWKAGTERKRVGVVGIGGLGHLGLQFAKALECEVTAISRSEAKKELCLTQLGADHFVAMADEEQVQKATASLDLILVTANGDNMDYSPFMNMLDTDGVLVVLGIPDNVIVNAKPFQLIVERKSIAGSLIGGRADIQRMLQLAADKGVRPIIEKRPMSEVNAATERMHNGKARFRIVLENDFAAQN